MAAFTQMRGGRENHLKVGRKKAICQNSCLLPELLMMLAAIGKIMD
jgi:hypothetical protein